MPPRQLAAAAETCLLELVRAQPDATLAELRDRLGVRCSLLTLAGALKRHPIPRKKMTVHAQEGDRPRVQRQRRAFTKKPAALGPDPLVFVAASGAHTGLTRTAGRAPRGERVQATAPGAWENGTLLAGLRSLGVVAPLAVPGAVESIVCQTDVQEAWVSARQAGAVVVMDTLQPHKKQAVSEALAAVGARVEPLPVYSPDLTPLEELFAKTKA